MRKPCLVLISLLIWGAAFAAAQPVPGKRFEFGTSLNFVSLKTQNDEPAQGALNIPVRFGWFFWKGFELEPEFTISFPIGAVTATTELLFLGNLTYNFKTAKPLVPFIGAGAGVGSGIMLLGGVEGKGTGVTVFDALCGVKALFGNVIGLRAEYRFNRYSYNLILEPEPIRGTYHQVMVGLSVFF